MLDGARTRGIYVEFYDPDGTRYGLPTYPYHWAPKHLLTIRQLRAPRPAPRRPAARRPDPVAQGHGASPTSTDTRLALPKRPPPRPSSRPSPPRCAPAAPAPPAGRKSPTASRVSHRDVQRLRRR